MAAATIPICAAEYECKGCFPVSHRCHLTSSMLWLCNQMSPRESSNRMVMPSPVRPFRFRYRFGREPGQFLDVICPLKP
jgi:hypothetical protein